MLCRDHCHYCTFAKPPAKLEYALPLAGRGGRRSPTPAAGWAARKRCSRSGDRPEERYDVARGWLEARGYGSTLDYVRAVAIRVIEETGLLPAPQPRRDVVRGDRPPEAGERVDGHDARDERRRACPSAGAPTSARPTRCRRSGCARSRTPAGSRSRSRPASWWASARPIASEPSRCSRSATLHRRYRHVQEVIVQNFRAKPGTAMQAAPEPDDEAFLAAVATARVVLGPRMHLQAPPNLSDPDQQVAPARRRDRRLGRRLAPHPRPRQPGEALALDRGAGRDHRLPGQAAPRTPHDLSRRTPPSPIPFLAGKMRAPVDGPPRPRWAGRRGAASGTRSRGRIPTSGGSPGRSRSRSPRPTERASVRTPMRSTATPTPPKPPARGPRREIHPERIERDIVAALAAAEAPSTDLRRTGAGAVPSRRRRRSTRSAASPTTCVPRPSATTSPTWSTGTSTSRTSATWGAGSARSRNARWMPSPTR